MTEEDKRSDAILRDKMWKTSKCRMRAETRYRRYHLAAHFFVSYYSLLVILASLFATELSAFLPSPDKIIIALSIAVFSWSLVLFGFRFSETADKHRECYLRIQRLLDTGASTDLAAEYHATIEHYPNHDSSDYNNLLVENAVFLRRPITDANTNTAIRPSIGTIISYFVRSILWAFLWLLFLALPFLVGIAPFYGRLLS
jgi:hypothetical protein